MDVVATHGIRSSAELADRLDVLVLDDHDASRLGLALLLRREAWVRRCSLAGDVRRAAEIVARERPDVAVVDVSNAGPFAGALVETLRGQHAGLRFLLTARCVTVPEPLVRQLGVRFLPPGTPGSALVAGVLAVAHEREAPTRAPAPPEDGLTMREREVLDLLATGATNREIAARLHLGPDSVKKHASAVYRKLGVRNRTEATRIAHARRTRSAPSPDGYSSG